MIKRIVGWLSPKPKQKVHAIVPRGHTLESWRNTPELSNQFKLLQEEQVFKHAIAVLYNAIPHGYPLRGEAINETQAAVALGATNGYMLCLSTLISLGQTPELVQQVEQDYGASNTTDKWS